LKGARTVGFMVILVLSNAISEIKCFVIMTSASAQLIINMTQTRKVAAISSVLKTVIAKCMIKIEFVNK